VVAKAVLTAVPKAVAVPAHVARQLKGLGLKHWIVMHSEKKVGEGTRK